MDAVNRSGKFDMKFEGFTGYYFTCPWCSHPFFSAHAL